MWFCFDFCFESNRNYLCWSWNRDKSKGPKIPGCPEFDPLKICGHYFFAKSMENKYWSKYFKKWSLLKFALQLKLSKNIKFLINIVILRIFSFSSVRLVRPKLRKWEKNRPVTKMNKNHKMRRLETFWKNGSLHKTITS